jgi:hypothetical protein
MIAVFLSCLMMVCLGLSWVGGVIVYQYRSRWGRRTNKELARLGNRAVCTFTRTSYQAHRPYICLTVHIVNACAVLPDLSSRPTFVPRCVAGKLGGAKGDQLDKMASESVVMQCIGDFLSTLDHGGLVERRVVIPTVSLTQRISCHNHALEQRVSQSKERHFGQRDKSEQALTVRDRDDAVPLIILSAGTCHE